MTGYKPLEQRKKTVAIIGRPNVGKSTLFNRIVKKRDAIVDNMPGVTRDRKYAIAEWAGVEFDLIDTGGYVPNSDDVFELAIRNQVRYALQEADVIVFLTDITTGITALDQEIASMLLKSSASVVLAVNKVDNDLRESDLYDFYALGLGDPLPISAMSGRSTGDFLDAVTARLPKTQNVVDSTDAIKMAVVGRPNVGKSSYINAILGQEKVIVTDIPGTTRDAIDTRFRYQNHFIDIIDTAGLRKRARVTENVEFFSTVRTMDAIRRCDVAIVLLDATQGITDQDKKIIGSAIDSGKGVAIGVNKWDLLEKDTDTARNFELDLQDSLRDISYIPVVFISALTKQRIFKLLDTAMIIFGERSKEISTADLNNFLEKSIQKHHPPAYGDKWVKINYVTQIRINPPTFVFFTNEPRGIRKDYKYFLENQMREIFGFLGVAVRLHFRKKN
jgi:GTPase